MRPASGAHSISNQELWLSAILGLNGSNGFTAVSMALSPFFSSKPRIAVWLFTPAAILAQCLIIYHAREDRTAFAYLIITEAPNGLYEFALGGETIL